MGPLSQHIDKQCILDTLINLLTCLTNLASIQATCQYKNMTMKERKVGVISGVKVGYIKEHDFS